MLTRASNRLEVTDSHPNSIDKSLGNRVRTKRLLAGLSQEQLAQKLSIDLEELASYESGMKRISAFHLLGLAQALGVLPVYFFGGSDERQVASAEDETHPWARAGVYLTLPDQGVRLNRAFVSVRNPDLREAIIRLVTEMGRNADAR